MRRIAIVAAAAGLSWTLAACGGPGSPQASDAQRPAAPAVAAPVPTVEAPVVTPPPTSPSASAAAVVPAYPYDHELDAEIDPPAAPRAAAPRVVKPRPPAVPSPRRTAAAPAKPAPVATAKASRPLAPAKPSADLVVPRPGMANLRAAGWERADVLDQRSLRIHFTGVSACRVLDSVRVDYRQTTVVVTLYTGTDPRHTDRVCAAVAQDKAVDVALAKPLAGRKVLDGSKPTSPVQPVAGAVEVHPEPGAIDTRALAWDRVEKVGPRTVRVFYSSAMAPCAVLDRVKVGYAKDRITVTLVVGRDPAAAGRPCAAALRPVYVDVTLAQPIADRRIVDGA
ncbi:MAG: hypothetical protein ACT4QG_01950 [Sporichthyaceae bacterium]